MSQEYLQVRNLGLYKQEPHLRRLRSHSFTKIASVKIGLIITLYLGEFMEPVTLTAVATAIATLLLTKSLEKVGENIGDAAWVQSRQLIEQLRNKSKLPLLTDALEADEQHRLDYGKAVFELKAAADKDPDIAKAVFEVEAAANNDKSETADKIQKLAQEIQSQPSVVNNFAKLAEEIKAEKGAIVAQQITIQQQTNTYN
jgi:hypothetical protein